MNLTETKNNFINQLDETILKISKYQIELEKLKEYKLKLQGGIEALELLSSQEEPTRLIKPEVVE